MRAKFKNGVIIENAALKKNKKESITVNVENAGLGRIVQMRTAAEFNGIAAAHVDNANHIPVFLPEKGNGAALFRFFNRQLLSDDFIALQHSPVDEP